MHDAKKGKFSRHVSDTRRSGSARVALNGLITKRAPLVPTFLIIGAGKCGTSSLYYYLRGHPDVSGPPAKETNFFVEDRSAEETEEYLRSLGTARARGEASVSYTNHPHPSGVAERIRQLVPDVRLIYLVGDPVVKFQRTYRQGVASHGESRTFTEVLATLDDPSEGYLDGCRYAVQLSQYLELFPWEQIRIVDQDDLASRPDVVVRELFEFLDVDPTFTTPRLQHRMNTARDQRVWGDTGQALRNSSAIHTFRRIPPKIRRPAVLAARAVLSKPVPPVSFDEEARKLLVERLAPEMERFRAMTGRTFPRWSI